MGADVAVLDRNPEALRRVDAVLGNRVRTLFSTRRGGASLPAGRSRHLDRSRAGLNHAAPRLSGQPWMGPSIAKLITAQTVKAVNTGAMASFGTSQDHVLRPQNRSRIVRQCRVWPPSNKAARFLPATEERKTLPQKLPQLAFKAGTKQACVDLLQRANERRP